MRFPPNSRVHVKRQKIECIILIFRTLVFCLYDSKLNYFRAAISGVTSWGMEAKLSHLTTLPSKDQANGYMSLLSDILTQLDQSHVASDVHSLVDFVTQDNVNIVVGRPVLGELVKGLMKNVSK